MYVLSMYIIHVLRRRNWQAAGDTAMAEPPNRGDARPSPVFRVVSAHSGADFEGHLTNRQRGEHLDSVEVEDTREHPPSAQQRHSAGHQQPAVARVVGAAAIGGIGAGRGRGLTPTPTLPHQAGLARASPQPPGFMFDPTVLRGAAQVYVQLWVAEVSQWWKLPVTFIVCFPLFYTPVNNLATVNKNISGSLPRQ